MNSGYSMVLKNYWYLAQLYFDRTKYKLPTKPAILLAQLKIKYHDLCNILSSRDLEIFY